MIMLGLAVLAAAFTDRQKRRVQVWREECESETKKKLEEGKSQKKNNSWELKWFFLSIKLDNFWAL